MTYTFHKTIKTIMKYLFIFISFISFAQKQTVSKLSILDYQQLSDLYLSEKDTIEKKAVADYFLKKAEKDQDDFNIVLGNIYISQIEKEPNVIEKYIDTAINHAKNYVSDSHLLSYSYYVKACHFFDKRKYNISLNNYILADKHLNRMDNEGLYYDIQFSIAIINSSLLNYKEALPVFLDYHNYYLELYKQPNLNAVFAIAESYNRLGNIKLSKYYTNYGKKWSTILNSDPSIFLFTEGIDCYKEKKYVKSIQILQKSLLHAKDDFANYATNSFYIGKSYLGLNDEKKAMLFFKKVDSVFGIRKNITVERIEAYKYLIDFYKKKRDIVNQLHYTNNLIRADSTLRSDYEYLTEKIHKDYNIPKLLQNKESLIGQLKKEKIYFISFMIFCVILIFIIVFIFTKKQKKLLKNQQLAFEKYKSNQLNADIKKDFVEKAPQKITDEIFIIHDEVTESILVKLSILVENKFFLDKDCTLDKLAKLLATNTTYLSKIINEKMGVSFPNYLNGLRIDYAVLQLENDEFEKYNIKGIASASGFNNSDSFSRAFTLRMNMKPTFFLDKIKNK